MMCTRKWINYCLLIWSLVLGSRSIGQECPRLIYPQDGATNVPVNPTITWNTVNGVEGYLLSLGTTPGGNDILNSRSAGHVNSFTPVTGLPDDTLIYATISLFLPDTGGLKACASETFSTEDIVEPPPCTTLNMLDIDGGTIRPGSDILWNYAPTATGYRVSIGTSPGISDIVDNFDVGNVLNYSPENDLPAEQQIFITIIPYNENGDAAPCTEESLRIGDSNIDCSAFQPIIELPDQISVCPGGFPKRIIGNVASHGVRWYRLDGTAETMISDVPEILIGETGRYRYEVFNNVSYFGETGRCTSTKEFTVVLSEPPEITDIEVSRVDERLNLHIQVRGNGVYEYALNDQNGFYQSSAIFNNVEAKDQVVYVREENGCGQTQKEILLTLNPKNFPKFFTPNGDGVNDYWQYLPNEYSALNNLEAIHIFDRFGRLLAQIDLFSKGWDGNFRGNPVPSSDYWFIATSASNQKYKGHFALKR